MIQLLLTIFTSLILFSFSVCNLYAEVIRGRITNSKTNLPIAYADISCSNKLLFAKSNANGEFLISDVKLPVTLKIQKFGYNDKTVAVENASEVLISLAPIEIQKKKLSYAPEYATLLKKAIEKNSEYAGSPIKNSPIRKLFYCKSFSLEDSALISFFESYAHLNVSKNAVTGYCPNVSRYTSKSSIPGLFENKLEVDIDPFFKLPFFVEKQIKRIGLFEKNGTQIALVRFNTGETAKEYYINVADTSIIYIVQHFKSKRKRKLADQVKTFQDDQDFLTEIAFLPNAGNNKGYIVNCVIYHQSFKLFQKKQPNRTIQQSSIYSLVPDSSLINASVKEYVFNETLIGARRQINFNANYPFSANTSFFESEMQKLLLKPYKSVFWNQYSMMVPTPAEHKQIKQWENNNRFYSESKLLPANKIICADTLVHIMNRNIVKVENVFIEPDRPNYLAGDTIWFSAFVLDNLSMGPTTTSAVLYVDLINAENRIEKQLKLYIKNGRGYGDFALAKDLKNGMFRIRAYTQYMRNFQSDYFFEKDIPVYQSNIENLLAVTPIINKSEAGDSVNLLLNALLPTKYKTLEKQLRVHITLNDTLSITKSLPFTNKFNGSFGFFVPSSLSCPFADIKLTLYDTAFITEQRISVPLKAGADIQFFPESGKMVAGIETLIAFKATDGKGNPTGFEADIIDQDDNKVLHITGDKSGIGRFVFTPQLNKIYRAIVFNQGNKYVIKLPVTEPEGYVLAYEPVFSSMNIKSNMAHQSGKHYLLVSVRGAVYTLVEAKLSGKAVRVKIPFNTYPKGIVQITLLDNLFRPLAERLVFNNRTDSKMCIHIETDKKEYQYKEKINATIKVTNAAGQPVEASLSMAVVDASKIDTLSCSTNIESYLYLSSELKGQIDYSLLNLSDTSYAGKRKIDLMMMTQGWGNFLWNSIRYRNSIKNQFPIEKGFYLNGKVVNYNQRKKGSEYWAVFDKKNIGFSKAFKVNENGNFHVEFPLFYEDTIKSHINIISNLTSYKGRIKDIKFNLDRVPEPEILYRDNDLPYTLYKPHYLNSMNEKFAQIDSTYGQYLKNIAIQEVVIKSKLKPWNTKPDVFVDLDKTDPKGKKYSSLFQMLRAEFGEAAFKDGHGNYCNPILIVNDKQYKMPLACEQDCPECQTEPYKWASTRPVNEISNVKLYKAGSTYSQFSTPPCPPPGECPYCFWVPLPVVSFKTYTHQYRGDSPTVLTLQFQGIYNAKEFYKPNYGQQKSTVADNRTTIYWNPEIKTDSTGSAQLSFYNSDLNGKAQIRVSGVSFQINGASTSVAGYNSK